MRTGNFLFFILFVLSTNAGYATSRATVEAVAVANVASAMRLYAEMNGRLPTNWSEIEQVIDINSLNERSLAESPAYPIQNHYLFVQEKIPMLGFQEGEVLLIRTSPVKNSAGERGRYIISRSNGELLFRFYKEEKVRQMLAQAGITSGVLLPPEKPYSSLWWLASAVLLLAAVTGYLFVRRRRKGLPSTGKATPCC